MSRRETGFCRVTSSDGAAWHLVRDQYEPVRTAWLKGCAFIDTVDFYGSKLTIKLANVDAIADVSPEAVQVAEAEDMVDA